jgi:hypothetical protein
VEIGLAFDGGVHASWHVVGLALNAFGGAAAGSASYVGLTLSLEMG